MTDVLRALWLVVATLAPAAAGYGVAVHFYRDRGVFDRLLVALMSFVSLIVVTFLVADLVRPISAVSLFVISTVGSIGVLKFLQVRGSAPRVLLAQLREDVRAPGRLFADALATKEPLTLLVLPALLILAWCVFMVLFFRSWGWDVLMFHTTITNTIVQDGSLGFMDTGFHQARGYPRNVHLLAAWNVFFLGNTALDDAPQLPFGLIGALVAAAWARRLGVSRAAATGLGAAWLCFAPVFMQLPSVHVDVACGALLGAGAYFSSFSLERRDRWATAMAFGLYLGTKHTGLFHLAMYAPLLVGRALWELKGTESRGRLFLNQVGSAALLLLLGSHKYVQNALVMGNPAWPFKTKLPFFGELPGENDASSQYGGPPGGRAAFFGIPGELERFVDQLRHWDKAVYFPDVRDGYFGIAFTCVAIPCLVLALGALAKRERRWQPLALWYLAIASVSVPSAFWPRYSMGSSLAGVAAIGLVWALAPWRAARLAVSAVTLGFFTYSLFLCGRELERNPAYGWTTMWKQAPFWTSLERNTKQVVSWNWPEAEAVFREQHFKAGEVVTWDESVGFPGEFFSPDLRTKIVFVKSRPDLATLAQRTRDKGARWSIVAGGGPDQVLEQAGARRVGPIGAGQFWLFEWPRS
ncbi:MAG: hypothetical protein JNJ54_37305 [Myxococcaceae bacterium]|nr:hypothetical protein [Myxococcaceae bacterium]